MAEANLSSREDRSSLWSFISMGFVDELLHVGSRKTLDMNDLGGISERDRADVLRIKFEAAMSAEVQAHPDPKTRSLWRVMWHTVGVTRLILGILLFIFSAALQFGPVLILAKLVRNFQGVETYSTVSLWSMVALLFVFTVAGSLCVAHSNALMAHLGAQFRNTLLCAIYRKALRISPFTKQAVSAGRIITMFADDTNQLRSFLYVVTNWAVAPLQIGVCTYLIYNQIGVATFVGLGYTMLTTPLTGFILRAVFGLRVAKMKLTDKRVRLINEVLNGIRILKYYVWERAFISKVEEIRDEEVALVSKSGYIFQASFGLLFVGATQVQSILIFLTFIALGNQLDAATAFTTITLFGLMTSPFYFLPVGLQQYQQSVIAMGRILDFLGRDDLTPYVDSAASGEDDEVSIEFRDACTSWSPDEGEAPAPTHRQVSASGDTYAAPSGQANADDEAKADDAPAEVDYSNRGVHTLRGLSLKVKRGQLVAIVGPVGSGKSSLLSTLLGEMVLRSGSVSIRPRRASPSVAQTIAYTDQRPWIVNATVEENITFGLPLDEARMRRAVSAACMMDDLKLLSAGLQTEIGERGVNLSGGQRARVALARAVYSDGDIYLIDDVLAAVDTHVGAHLLDRCILGVLAGKTRLLVTNHLPVLPRCDLVVILEADGTVKAAGSFEEMMASGIDVSHYATSNKEAEAEAEAEVGPEVCTEINAEAAEESGSEAVPAVEDAGIDDPAKEKDHDKDLGTSKAGALISTEERAEGGVTFSTYWTYARYGGLVPFFILVLFQLGSQVLSIEANFWLADWGRETTTDVAAGRTMSPERSFFWLHGFAGLNIGSIGAVLVSRMALNYHRTSASRVFHRRLLGTVMALPVSWFDITPVGRIVNRFSQDIATIDEDLVMSITQSTFLVSGVLGAIGAIAGATQGSFLVLLVPLCYLYSRFQTFFRASNTAIARLEATSRSPIYADFSQTLAGTSTIRAYRQQERYTVQLEKYANANTVPNVLQQICGQWLAIRLDLLSAVVILFMGVLCVSLQGKEFISPGLLALGLSYSIQLTALLKQAVRLLAILEQNFNSVERVKYYTELTEVEEGGEGGGGGDKLPLQAIGTVGTSASASASPSASASASCSDVEMQLLAPIRAPRSAAAAPADWPQHGRVQFEGVELRYRDGPKVLNGVSFDVQPRQKVGIAGRTGSGKSSLMVALFGIEPLCGGRILIDGVDIATVPLQLLRSKLAIIPQEPIMFSASLKFNIDPFNEYSVDEVWDVLRAVEMAEHVQSLPSQLDEVVAEGGDSLSAGQRQLVCIARAILRKPKLLVMDEATAAIDGHTDDIIQKMLRQSFAHATVLTVAHRLNTIIDSDVLLVMDKGRSAEYAPPQVLLAREDGLFRALWDRHKSSGGTAH